MKATGVYTPEPKSDAKRSREKPLAGEQSTEKLSRAQAQGDCTTASMASLPSPNRDQSRLVAELIHRCRAGDINARNLLIEHLYTDLRRIAAAQLARERPDHTLQPTALVHEAYARLMGRSELKPNDQAHFLASSAHLMRQILVDHARARLASKRGGSRKCKVTLDEHLLSNEVGPLDVLVVDQALTRLAQLDTRHSQIVEMHFFGGLTFEEIGTAIGVTEKTIQRDWVMARAWLRNEFSAKP